MKLTFGVLLFNLAASSAVAQTVKTSEDCGCISGVTAKSPTKSIVPSTPATQVELQKLIDSNLIDAYWENQEKINPTKEAWLKALSAFAEHENITMVLDLGTKIYARPPLIPSTKMRGADAMRALASAVVSTWKERSGVQIFARTHGLPIIEHQKALATIVDWLKGTDLGTKQELSKAGVVLSQVPPTARNAIMQSLHDRDMPFTLIDLYNETTVLLRLAPTIRVPATTTRPAISLPMTGFIPSLYLGNVYVPTADDAKNTVVPEPLQAATKGTLDFGMGVILP